MAASEDALLSIIKQINSLPVEEATEIFKYLKVKTGIEGSGCPEAYGDKPKDVYHKIEQMLKSGGSPASILLNDDSEIVEIPTSAASSSSNGYGRFNSPVYNNSENIDLDDALAEPALNGIPNWMSLVPYPDGYEMDSTPKSEIMSQKNTAGYRTTPLIKKGDRMKFFSACVLDILNSGISSNVEIAGKMNIEPSYVGFLLNGLKRRDLFSGSGFGKRINAKGISELKRMEGIYGETLHNWKSEAPKTDTNQTQAQIESIFKNFEELLESSTPLLYARSNEDEVTSIVVMQDYGCNDASDKFGSVCEQDSLPEYVEEKYRSHDDEINIESKISAYLGKKQFAKKVALFKFLHEMSCGMTEVDDLAAELNMLPGAVRSYLISLGNKGLISKNNGSRELTPFGMAVFAELEQKYGEKENKRPLLEGDSLYGNSDGLEDKNIVCETVTKEKPPLLDEPQKHILHKVTVHESVNGFKGTSKGNVFLLCDGEMIEKANDVPAHRPPSETYDRAATSIIYGKKDSSFRKNLPKAPLAGVASSSMQPQAEVDDSLWEKAGIYETRGRWEVFLEHGRKTLFSKGAPQETGLEYYGLLHDISTKGHSENFSVESRRHFIYLGWITGRNGDTQITEKGLRAEIVLEELMFPSDDEA